MKNISCNFKEIKMIYICDEGQTPKNGFNFYPLSSTTSAGFKFRFGKRLVMFRYSKKGKKFFVSYTKIGETTDWLKNIK